VRIVFTTASKRHKIARSHARYVMATCTPTPVTSNRGEAGWLYVGPDERGVELEVIAVELASGDLLVIHVMPTALRGGA
jgi:hypothetical protein